MKEVNAGEVAEKVVGQMMPIITSMMVSAVVGEVLKKVMMVTATNQHHTDPTGDHDAHATKQETQLEKNEATGSDTDESLAHDDVSGQKGEVDAAETEGKASTAEATAAEEGASAVRTKAGASDIETKALKMM